MTGRSSRAEVRNPVLLLPCANLFHGLPMEARTAFRAFLKDLIRHCRQKAELSWRSNKAPMACYWKVVGAWATHLSRVMKPDAPEYREHHWYGPVRYLATVDRDFVVVRQDGFVPVIISRSEWDAMSPAVASQERMAA